MRRFAKFFEQKRSEILHQRALIREAFEGGANTVAKISERTHLPEDLVLWNMMGLLKWGEIEVSGHENHELLYILKEV